MSGATELASGDVTLRAWRPGDEADLARLADNRKVSIHLRDRFPFPYTERDAHEFVAHASKSPDIWAVVWKGRVAGGIGLMPGEDIYRQTAEVGYWLGEPYWGNGIASTAVRLVSAHAFDHRDIVRLFATPFEDNPASARVLVKAGYRLESRQEQAVVKEGRTLDQWMYVRVRWGAVVDSDPEWAARFERLRERLETAVGDAALGIEHVGSTAVPGLAAKPVVDIDIVYDGPDDLAAIKDRLVGLGYALEGTKGIEGRESFRPPQGSEPHHLYACQAGSVALTNHLILRDHFRTDADDRAAYAAVKKKLGPKYLDSPSAYVEGKTQFLVGVLAKLGMTREQLSAIESSNRA